MSFPLSPANNQVTLENGIAYTYNASRGAWYRTPATALASLTSNTFTVLNSIIFSDGTSQTTAANPTDAYARTTANTATNNITIIQGVDTAQNTRMSIIEGVDVGQNTRMSIIEGVDTTQNTNITIATNAATAAFAQANATAGGLTTANARITIIEGVDLTQNTNITNADTKAQAAFDKANTSITTSGGSITGSLNVSQNLTVSGNLSVLGTTTSINTQQYEVVDPMIKLGIGNYTTDQVDIGFAGHYNDGANAHTGLVRDFATKDYFLFQGYTPELSGNNNIDINHASFATANLRASLLRGNVIATTVNIDGKDQTAVDATQNTNITAADTKAQAAFNKANDAYTIANTANSVAAAAAAASGGSSETFTTYIDRFTGNGSQTQFTLSTIPDTENQTMVFLNGVYQNKDTYSVSGANVIFTDTATANDTIEVTTFVKVINVNSSMYRTRIYQGDGSTTTFTISSGYTANTILLFNNGVAQFPVDDYTVSGTTLTYVLPPGSDETIQIRELPINTLVPATQALMRRYTANGVQTQFTVSSGQTANSMFVYENGICQVPINDYTVSDTILTFVTAPIANVVVQIRELSI
jgi:hypothetical protein